MHLSRRSRFLTVLLSLCALLLAQGALAGYACPGQTKAIELAQMAEAGMPCAQTMSVAMDEEQPGLCHAHCQASQPSSDTYQPPALASLMQLGAVLVLQLPEVEGTARAPHDGLSQHDGAPPLSVQHCCWRI